MTEWYTISAKFTSDEKKILDLIKKDYDLNFNQMLRASFELTLRIMSAAEFVASNKNKTLEGIKEISYKHSKEMESEIKQFLSTIPIEQQEQDYEEFSGGINSIFERFNEIFVKNRNLGRIPLERKRGRPKDLGKTS